MSRQLIYVACPLRPTEEEIPELIVDGQPRPTEAFDVALRANLDRAMRWLSWLRRSFPETTFIAPWIASVLAGADPADPAQREAGLVDDCAVIERCDGIVLCGGRISEGMQREREHGRLHHQPHREERRENSFKVYDLTGYSAEPPGVFEPDDDGAHQEFTANASQRTRDDAERLWRLGRR